MTEKLTEIADVIEWCQDNDIPADVVGRWVWVKFADKPSESIRDGLKAVGFRWVKHRGEWAHNCGWVSRRSPGRPRDKYGSVTPASRIGAIQAETCRECSSNTTRPPKLSGTVTDAIAARRRAIATASPHTTIVTSAPHKS